MFRKILIANRGEIACRVIRTAHRLGVRAVAVYSDADANAQHVRQADEAYRIGPAPARDSYLNVEAILGAVQASRAEAVHPGYGFLSENAGFAEVCAKAGVTFIGPPPDAIRAMGGKAAAKALMEKAKVPVVPGYHGDAQEPAKLADEAARIGYPVLIKATAGGGGKGMRIVAKADEFERALAGAKREAASAFGDDRVLIEKYVNRPRHVEIQVFADKHGNAIHLFERDCSVQRRHQKVLEEAPAPGMPPEMRAAMGKAAVAAAKAIGYVGAGTIEFIADASDGLRQDRFYFMEMNTRLQVEHPVTEMITGQDLVEWQLRVAYGEKLPLTQDQLTISGHAVEARIYAENPSRMFLPSVGTLHRLRFPQQGPHLRVDTGVVEGDEVTPYYDPMIAKLIVWDTSRAEALRRLAAATQQVEIAGVNANVAFLGSVASHPAFADGAVHTGFIDEHKATLIPAAAPVPDDALAVAAVDVLLRRVVTPPAGDPYSPWAATDGWRLNDAATSELHFKDGDTPITVTVHHRAGGWSLELPGGRVDALAVRDAEDRLSVDLGGRRFIASVAHIGRELVVLIGGRSWRLAEVDPLAVEGIEDAAGAAVIAPMPGKVIQVMAKAGESVRKGAALLVLEAMKMEHTLTAAADGTVAAVNCAVGDQVTEGTVLVAFQE
jgi:3-methylcrotonyl-CoA carboxylase alpha subunit